MVSRAAVPSFDLAPPKPWRRFIPTWLRSLIWIDSAGKYDAFLSYSWKFDSKIAPVIQSVIQRFLCPWYKLRAKTVFRDLSCLPAGSSLEKELFDRLDRSTHLIVLASPEAATSHGMEIEANHWFSRKRDGEVVVVISSGEDKSWDWIRDHLVPPSVRDNLPSEPLWIRLQHRRDEILANPNSHRLCAELIEDLKQLLLRLYPDRDWGQLRGEERSQRRRALGLLAGLALLFLALFVVAFFETLKARQETRVAVSRQLASQALEELWRSPRSSAKDVIDALKNYKTVEATKALNEVFSQCHAIAVLSHENDAPLSGVAFSGNGRFVITSTYQAIWLWDFTATKEPRYFRSGDFLRVSANSLSHDGRYILASFEDKEKGKYGVVIYDTSANTRGSFVASKIGPITAATFSPSGKYIATAGWDWTASVWDADEVLRASLSSTTSGPIEVKPIANTKLHSDIINSIHFGSDENYVVTASQDGKAKIWNWNSSRKVELRRYTRALFSAEFHPKDVHTVLTAGQDGISSLWECNEACNHRDRAFGFADARQAAFDAEGAQIVTSSSDGKAFIWSPTDGQNYTLEGHRGAVTGSAFSPDGRFIATASMDGTARIWIAKPVPALQDEQAKIQYLKSLSSVR